jgi:hypothetical protein
VWPRFAEKFAQFSVAGERDHIFVQVGETNRERVEFRVGFREQNPDVFRIAPGKFFWHNNPVVRLSLFAIRLVNFTFVHPRSKAKQRMTNSEKRTAASQCSSET